MPPFSRDIYSLGVVLYHLLTDAYPVRGADLHGLREAHQRGESTPLASARPDLPTSLARIIDRAIAREPELRYASADALAADLASSTALAAHVFGSGRDSGVHCLPGVERVGDHGWQVSRRARRGCAGRVASRRLAPRPCRTR